MMRLARSLPKVRQAPLIGSLLSFRQDQLAFFQRLYRECGPVGRFNILHLEAFVLFDPEDIAELLDAKAAFFEKDWTQRLLRPAFGEGIFLTGSDRHTSQRAAINPAFDHSLLIEQVDGLTEIAWRAVRSLPRDVTVNLYNAFVPLSIDLGIRTVLGMVRDADRDTIVRSLMSLTDDFAAFLDAPLPSSLPTPRNRRMQRTTTELNTTIRRIIAERRRAPANDLISVLLTGDLTDDELLNEVKNLLAGGNQSIANALAWTLALIGRYPEVQDRAVAEVDAVSGSRPVTFSDLPRLTFLHDVIQESLRLYPTAFTFGREAREDVTIGDTRFPRGSTINVVPYMVHHRADLFANPERFDPDRWTPAMRAALPRFAYLPFGGGPRGCIGERLALMEMQVVLATFLQTVRWRVPVLPTIEAVLFLRPRGGLPVALHDR